MYKRLDKNFWKKYFRFYDVLNELKPYSDTLGAIVNIIPKDQLLFILEIGCGTGNLLYRIIKSRNNIYKIFGIDYSQEALNTAREKLSDFKNFELFYGDINVSLPFGDNIFDVLVMHNVLYTIDSNSRPFLSKEMYRILKPGGLVIMANINTNFKPTKIYSH
ncbi:MAG: class I SAM-dependent methyltransferase, partial [Patescibacteria group bacterium]